MTITACVKNKRTSSLPQNPSLVALLFKDKRGLANHPLSCHPQGVFGRRESERKLEKEKQAGELKKHGTSSCLQILHSTAFSFKKEGFLATHLPSCHLGECLAAQKMRENGRM